MVESAKVIHRCANGKDCGGGKKAETPRGGGLYTDPRQSKLGVRQVAVQRCHADTCSARS